MKFWQSVAFSEPEQLLEIARGAEAAGFEGLLLSEHLFVPEEMAPKYPYAEDGIPDFTGDTPFPDPWSAISAMASVTTRLRFSTMIYVLPLRHPLEVAKAVSTAAVLSGNRVVLGAGAGWMREEYDTLGVPFESRGKRFDESIEVLRRVWSGQAVEHHGRFFDFPRIRMSPAPSEPIPILIGGMSKPALARAARLGDGWLGAGNTPKEAAELLRELRRMRDRGVLVLPLLHRATSWADPRPSLPKLKPICPGFSGYPVNSLFFSKGWLVLVGASCSDKETALCLPASDPPARVQTRSGVAFGHDQSSPPVAPHPIGDSGLLQQ